MSSLNTNASYKTIAPAAALLAALLLAPRPAWPCGGGFGEGLNIDPSQKIVVAFSGGQETYVFSPHFCGEAAQFGLILPVPGKLSVNPALADAKLFDELEAISAPKRVKKARCEGWSPDGGAIGGYGDAGSWNNGVDVVDRGQVGIFDWALLKADSAKAFTDWLDANNFPHNASADAPFAYYVTQGWYFVAFKITADSKAPPPGKQLCGDLGPIQLTFAAAQPVVPARIAAVNSSSGWSFGWRVFALADKQLTSTTASVYPKLRYSGALTAQQLSQHTEVAKLAKAGQRLTKLDLEIYSANLQDDIQLQADPGQADFRQTVIEYVYVKCEAGGVMLDDAGQPLLDDAGQPRLMESDGGSCSLGGDPAASLPLGAALLGLGLAAWIGRRRRRG